MNPNADLEAGPVPQATPSDREVRRSETHEMATIQPHESTIPSVVFPVFGSQNVDHEEQSEAREVTSTASSHSMRSGSNIDNPQRSVNDTTSDQPTRAGQGPSQEEAQTQPEGPPISNDFDRSAGEFWKLFKDEAKSHDDARIFSLKQDMESALIFAGLFSAALTGFVLDSKQDLKVKPADEMVYYLRQHSTILSQISVQLSSIAPQVSIPSTPPAPFPAFSPLPSDVLVNAFWFMALVFGLIAALLSILVQKWVRDYMHVFNRYSDPLKSARLRQYLYDGCEEWYMPMVAEVVPGCLHISLFLFFIGLADSLFNINTTVGISTIVPIGICGLLYILIAFLPIISPQSPYQNSFSGIIWFLFQKLRVRNYGDRGHDGESKPVDTSMAEGRMQLAMKETGARKGRDAEAIRWLIDNMTEDAEMEKLLYAIPGSFNTDWGMEVWKEVGKRKEEASDDRSQDEPAQAAGPRVDTTRARSVDRHSPTNAMTYSSTRYRPNAHADSATAHKKNIVQELSERVNRSLVVCKSRGLFEKDELWRKHTRACVETTSLLVCCANAKIRWFGDIMEPLGSIGTSVKTRQSSLKGTDQLFVMRWTCLSLVAIRPILEDKRVRNAAQDGVWSFEYKDDTGNREASAGAQKIAENLQKARKCLIQLYRALPKENDLTEEVEENLLGAAKSEISELAQLDVEADNIQSVDSWISHIQSIIDEYSYGITSQIPGVIDNLDKPFILYEEPVPFSRVGELLREPRKRQFILPGRTLKSMCSPALTLSKILEGQANADEYQGLLKELLQNSNLIYKNDFPDSYLRWGHVMQRQLMRLQDLCEGGGLGFMVELFFLAFDQLLSKSSSKESHSALYTGTFRAITSGWNKYKGSVGTQQLLINIVFHVVVDHKTYPPYIVDESISLLGNILEGQTGPHINRAVQQFRNFRSITSVEDFDNRMSRVFTGAQPPYL